MLTVVLITKFMEIYQTTDLTCSIRQEKKQLSRQRQKLYFSDKEGKEEVEKEAELV